MRGHDLSNRVARLEQWVAYLRQFAPQFMQADPATFALTGSDASLRATGRKLVAGPGAYALTGQAATLRRSRVIAASPVSFALTGQSATLFKGKRVVADTVSFALTGQAATLKRAMKVVASTTSFALTGQAATLTKSSGTPAIVSSIGTNGPSASSPAVVSLPASLVSGNKIVIIFGHNPTATVTTPSGWTLLDSVQSTVGTNDRKIYIFEKTSDGTEGATVNITISGQTWSAVAYQISGSASATLVAKVGASVASVNPDPPDNNPGSSALTLWIAAACKRQTTTLSAAPSGYANLVTGLSSGSNVSTAAADKTSTASSEDPGTFTGTGSDNWAAITLGFRA